jgi:hypothetical protein
MKKTSTLTFVPVVMDAPMSLTRNGREFFSNNPKFILSWSNLSFHLDTYKTRGILGMTRVTSKDLTEKQDCYVTTAEQLFYNRISPINNHTPISSQAVLGALGHWFMDIKSLKYATRTFLTPNTFSVLPLHILIEGEPNPALVQYKDVKCAFDIQAEDTDYLLPIYLAKTGDSGHNRLKAVAQGLKDAEQVARRLLAFMEPQAKFTLKPASLVPQRKNEEGKYIVPT